MFLRTVTIFVAFLSLAFAAYDVERSLDVTGTHAWAMALDSVTALIGPGDPNEFTVHLTHNNVTAATLTGTIMNPACTATANTGGLSVGSYNRLAAGTIDPKVGVNFSTLGSAVWTPGTTSGVISFCYKLEATVSGEIVSDIRIQITATVDLTNDSWSVSSINVADTSPSVATALNVAVDYTLTAFICNDSGEVVATPPAITPGGTLQVCITYPDGVAGVTVGSVYQSTISQPTGPSLETIATGTVQHDFTSVDCSSIANLCRIKSNIVRGFFLDDTKDLTIAGTALMFIGRRMLRVPVGQRRTSEVTGEPVKVGAFSLDFPFKPEVTTSGTISLNAFVAFAASVVTATVLALS